MAEEPTVPTPLDAIDLESLSEDELQRSAAPPLAGRRGQGPASSAPRVCSG
jgi:hypothetical protein